jgi:hypothetical protein
MSSHAGHARMFESRVPAGELIYAHAPANQDTGHQDSGIGNREAGPHPKPAPPYSPGLLPC